MSFPPIKPIPSIEDRKKLSKAPSPKVVTTKHKPKVKSMKKAKKSTRSSKSKVKSVKKPAARGFFAALKRLAGL